MVVQGEGTWLFKAGYKGTARQRPSSGEAINQLVGAVASSKTAKALKR